MRESIEAARPQTFLKHIVPASVAISAISRSLWSTARQPQY
jgi:hypothetical protein